jgi:hypothetical protein
MLNPQHAARDASAGIEGPEGALDGVRDICATRTGALPVSESNFFVAWNLTGNFTELLLFCGD